MKVLMLNNEFPPLGGGTATVNHCLLKEFSCTSGLQIDLVTSSRTASEFEEERFAENIRIFKVPVDNKDIHHSTLIELLRYSGRALIKSLELTRKNSYDVALAFSGVPAGGVGLCLRVARKLPYIVSLQGPDIPGFEVRYRYLYPFLTPVIRLIWRYAAVVFALSEQHRALALLCGTAVEIPIIFNGVDNAVFYPAAGRAVGVPLNIICAARLVKRKGHEYLIRALAEIKSNNPAAEFKLTVVGTGDLEAELRDQCCQLGLTDRVCFCGYVAREKMPEIYRSADIFVLPSEHEGMSLALLEALASGLPAIVTPVGGTKELVQNGINGYVVGYAEVDPLRAALEKLLVDSDLRQKMGRESLRVSRGFSWSRIADEYLRLFEQAASRSAFAK